MSVGDGGAGTLSVSNGADLTVGSISIAANAGSTGTVTISGTASRMAFNDALYVGGAASAAGGAARLSIGAGAIHRARSP
jgi:T5SS/PEP-CTERM-associated repeat protein